MFFSMFCCCKMFYMFLFVYLRVKGVQSMEELRDVYQHFLLYYGTEIPKMRALEKEKKRKEAAGGGEDGENNDDETHEIIKSATRKSGYNLCERAGLGKCWWKIKK